MTLDRTTNETSSRITVADSSSGSRCARLAVHKPIFALSSIRTAAVIPISTHPPTNSSRDGDSWRMSDTNMAMTNTSISSSSTVFWTAGRIAKMPSSAHSTHRSGLLSAADSTF